MKKLIIILLTYTIIGCSEKNSTEASFVLATGVRFKLLDESGKDLLNPNTINYFPIDSMKLYHKINEEIIEVYDENMEYPRNISLITESNPYQIGFGSYSGYEGEISEIDGIKRGVSINYLEFNSEITDTITVEWEAKKGIYFVNTKIWYNNTLYNPDNMPFVVTKEGNYR